MAPDLTPASGLSARLARAFESLRAGLALLVLRALGQEDAALKAEGERQRTERVLARVADGKFIVDSQGRVLMMDPVAEGIAGKRLSDVAGKPLLESLGGGERLVALAADPDGPAPGEVRVSGEQELVRAMRQSLALVQDERGRTLGACAVAPFASKLREAMRLQEAFVANMTHDLKTPLASICSALEIVRRRLGPALSEEDAAFIDIGLRNSRRLRRMIDQVLDFSRLRSGAVTVAPKPEDACALVREAVEALGPWAKARKLALTQAAPPGGAPGKVLADWGAVVQVLANLVSNAVKFTPPGGRITVSAVRGEGPRAGSVVFCVKDDGRGIAPEDHARIFERFTQVGPPARGEGLGLGLAIVRELVARHGGELWVQSASGRGSAFHFTLPRA